MTESKPSNPKDALGINKVPLHTVPTKPLLEVALAMMEGGRKYGTHNYRVIGVRMSTYYNAAMRHLMSWWEGEDIDPDSGVHHLIKAIASLFVVRDAMHMDMCTDDRPPNYPGGIEIAAFNAIAAGIIKEYPECAEPFTQIKTSILNEVKAIPPTKGETLEEVLAINEDMAEEFDKEEPVEEVEEITDHDHPDYLWYCSEFNCFERGKANSGHMAFYCDEHKEVT